MDDREVDALAAIMIRRHGTAAELVARKRALRSKRMLEDIWVVTWTKVAEHIARNLPAAAESAKPNAKTPQATARKSSESPGHLDE
jgi:hypothetical protein